MTKTTLQKDTPSIEVNVFAEHYRIADRFVSTDTAGNSEQNQKDAVISKAFLYKFTLLLACPRVVLTEVYHCFLRTEGMREVPIYPLPFFSGS